ncbi:hypothetical protein [Nitrosomonas sp. HPC101]|nr:hypothetical protein [Nitrosomonas sp. HPC101]
MKPRFTNNQIIETLKQTETGLTMLELYRKPGIKMGAQAMADVIRQ